MPDLYSPKQVSDILDVSASAIRIYTDRYADKLSTEATTPPRKFRPDDLKALAFVTHSTSQGKTHDEVLTTWDEEFPGFEWEPPIEQEADAGAMVPIAEVYAMRAMLQDAQRRELEAKQEAQAQADQLREEIRRLERDLGKAEGELTAQQRTEEERADRVAKLEEELARLRTQATEQRRGWWARLFGGGE